MTKINPARSQWEQQQHHDTTATTTSSHPDEDDVVDPAVSWEGDSREDAAVLLSRRNSRRKSAPKNFEDDDDDKEEKQQDPLLPLQSSTTPSPPLITNKMKTSKTSKQRQQQQQQQQRRRDLVRSRHHQDVVTLSPTQKPQTKLNTTTDPDAAFHHAARDEPVVHTPLHHFMHPPTTTTTDDDDDDDDDHGKDNLTSGRFSFRNNGKSQLLLQLNQKGGGQGDHNNHRAQAQAQQQEQQSQQQQHHHVPKGIDFSTDDGLHSDEISTASTSGSNSSSSTSQDATTNTTTTMKSTRDTTTTPPPPSTVISSTTCSFSAAAIMDSDQELELYSRQIRLELRQAEMLELAEEAERAAASGKKSFTGRASTFCDDKELELFSVDKITTTTTKRSPPGSRSHHERNQVVRRTLDFGTPLVRRLQREPSKISVVALRDVAEVVPAFKDFHLHLRTHFVRRQVDERVLFFEEREESTTPSLDCYSSRAHGRNERNMIQLWNSFNFGTWTTTASSKRSILEDDDFNPCMKGMSMPVLNEEEYPAENDARSLQSQSQQESGPDDLSAAGGSGSDVGTLLAEHMHTPRSRGRRRGGARRLHNVEVPPGLSLADNEDDNNKSSFSAATEETDDGTPKEEAVEAEKSSAADGATTTPESHPSTPKQQQQQVKKTSEGSTLETVPTTSSSEGHACGKYPQGGSPHSPIIIEDIDDMEDSSCTPDQNSRTRLYRGPNPPPALPVTPKDNFQRVFESKFTTPKDERLQERMATRISSSSAAAPNEDSSSRDNNILFGPDFVTPVRLRDIRDDHILEHPDFLARIPNAPLLRNYMIAEKPNSIRDHQQDTFPIASQNLWNSNDEGMPYNSRFMEGSGSCPDTQKGPRLAQRSIPPRTSGNNNNSINGDRATIATLLDSDQVERLPSAGMSASANYSRKQGKDMRLRFPVSTSSYQATTMLEASSKKPHVDPDGVYLSGGCDRSERRLSHSVSMPLMAGPTTYEFIDVPKGKSYDVSTSNGKFCEVHQTVGESTKEGTKTNASRHEKITKARAYGTKEPDKVFSVGNRNETSVLVDFNGLDKTALQRGSGSGDSKPADESKATADFGCECLISPASSLDSDEGAGIKRHSAWNLMDNAPISPSESNHKSLQAAVAMFSRISPSGSRRLLGTVVYASSKENDDFMSNYLYCSKTEEAPPVAEPICSGSVPCQDTKMPCGEFAVDSCVGSFLDTALKFLPRKSSEGKKLLSLDRDDRNELQSKPGSWYDIANEKFDRLLERLMGGEHNRLHDQSRLSYQAPSLKERKTFQQGQDTTSPPLHDEIPEYDEDLEGVVYVKTTTSSLEVNSSNSYSSYSYHSSGGQRHHRGDRDRAHHRSRRSKKMNNRSSSLHHSLSDTAQLRDKNNSTVVERSVDTRNSM